MEYARFVQAADHAEHFIHHRGKMFAVMDIAGIDAVIERQP